jgi:hypothetical protein
VVVGDLVVVVRDSPEIKGGTKARAKDTK